ncbi:MAG: GNAT family N-acetyltransferase [Chloroflexaceae bacterium]|nr:GNAT family N-acetyltransferase [Chloroflexaceae bacterium]
MQVQWADTDETLKRCFPIIVQLRPHLNLEAFIAQVKRQHAQNGYHVVYAEDAGCIKSVAGFKIDEMLWRGRILYIDDLVTESSERSRGYGDHLFTWLVNYARSQGCNQVDLDSGVQRIGAHRFYFRKGMHITSYHFTLKLDDHRKQDL